ncbi:MAG: HD domain-containing protein [Bacteriovoracaceae bacterium]|nr:HD domain-containing protein [Bacteriovoracaceae bacterium]
MQRVNVADLKPKEEIESVFLVKFIALFEAKDGKKYLNIILSDGTGEIESRIWKDAEEISKSVEKGNFVKVRGKANMYMGKKQFVIAACEKFPDSEINKDDFIVKAKRAPQEMFDDLVAIVQNLEDVYIRQLLLNVLGDKEVERRLKIWQAGKSIHHAYQGGLLEHILSCSNLSVQLSSHYNVNTSYVVAGAILHDLCKIYELTDGFNVEYTEEGKLVGHLVKGVEIVDKYSYRIKDFPYQTKLHLKHVLLSHHGHYEYGSPKIPQTSEAMLLHLIDHMDSKMHSFETIKRTDQNTGRWSGYVKHLDRIIYKEELPFYPEFIDGPERAETEPRQSRSKDHSSGPKKGKYKEKEVKQNLGNLLKDFKVDK